MNGTSLTENPSEPVYLTDIFFALRMSHKGNQNCANQYVKEPTLRIERKEKLAFTFPSREEEKTAKRD